MQKEYKEYQDIMDNFRYAIEDIPFSPDLFKIIDVIKKWLSIIPGINKFFLEQEAKIKTDKIMELKK